MKSFLISITFICALLSMSVSQGLTQTVEGVWKTIDDKSGEPKSHVKIYQEGDKLYGKVVKLLPQVKQKTCDDCPGDKKGKPIVGMQILWDLEKIEDGYWGNGEILDPKSGKVYNGKLWLENDDELTVRGYIGISLLGRSQSWYRVK